MDETKYRNLFVAQLRGSASDFDNEFKRVIRENGYSEELKKEFYFAAFDSIIKVNKNLLVRKDEFYKENVVALYNLFINALIEDGIDYSSIEEKKANFEKNEFPEVNLYAKDIKSNKPAPEYIPTYKQYNPNTKYGRRKAREQAQRNYENGTEEYRNDIDNIKIILWLIVIVVGIIFFYIKTKLSS
ncbi:hypothetical protein [Flavobacterium chungangense]|uniref:Uncharacterized protein n=1 Tax=Flavobacterium chungangense TaxID=554283 RepID=A0A6V6YLY6_9FLAO|nr:hypothetical protein [Flavobacterium chungangense]CAD0000461.1 hypothetical protein FLACHUCJ7_00069 [Flavobacterium chungangense]